MSCQLSHLLHSDLPSKLAQPRLNVAEPSSSRWNPASCVHFPPSRLPPLVTASANSLHCPRRSAQRNRLSRASPPSYPLRDLLISGTVLAGYTPLHPQGLGPNWGLYLVCRDVYWLSKHGTASSPRLQLGQPRMRDLPAPPLTLTVLQMSSRHSR